MIKRHVGYQLKRNEHKRLVPQRLATDTCWPNALSVIYIHNRACFFRGKKQTLIIAPLLSFRRSLPRVGSWGKVAPVLVNSDK